MTILRRLCGRLTLSPRLLCVWPANVCVCVCRVSVRVSAHNLRSSRVGYLCPRLSRLARPFSVLPSWPLTLVFRHVVVSVVSVSFPFLSFVSLPCSSSLSASCGERTLGC